MILGSQLRLEIISKLREIYTCNLLLTTPKVRGDNTPIANITSGIHLPILCFLSLQIPIDAAITCTNMEEKSAHRNTWYHISETKTKKFLNRNHFSKKIKRTNNLNILNILCIGTLDSTALTQQYDGPALFQWLIRYTYLPYTPIITILENSFQLYQMLKNIGLDLDSNQGL